MGPEVLIALISAAAVIVAAGLGAAPALVALLRRTRVAVAEDGAATREALEALGAVLHARIGDVRDDIDDVREDVARVREWQAGHDAEHLLIGRPPGGDAT
ncbi:hypothetical protein AB0N28_03710 [Streptomyces sp. NPDC051130]|uniref:hypothetical protein n=1 Tax=Streptomyces sp. NPDC051130 TaxID=3157223 RepID=UPI00343D7BF0